MAGRAGLLVGVLAVALALTPAAGARIVVQKGIGGAELGMTRANVRAKLGTPLRVKHGSNDFGQYTEFVYRTVTVSFQGNAKVTGMRTSSRRERTARGIGVGSTLVQVRGNVPSVRCRNEFGSLHCWVGRFLPGRRVTDFLFRKGRVSSVVVGYVLD
jgi:hypothetical protein